MYHKIQKTFKALLYMFLSIDIFKIMKDILYMVAFSYLFGLITVLQLQDTFELSAIRYYALLFFNIFMACKFTLEVLRYITLEEYSGWFEKRKNFSFKTSVFHDIPSAVLEKSAKDTDYESKKKIAISRNYRLNSIHEAGHVVAAYLLEVHVDHVAVTPVNGATYLDESFNINFEGNLKKSILIDYAGFVAEKMILGHISYGNFGRDTADFEKARTSIKKYLALQDFQRHQTVGRVLSCLYSDPKDCQSKEYLQSLEHTEQKFYQEAAALLEHHRSLIEAVAATLEEKHYLDSDNIDHIIKIHSERTVKEGAAL